MEQHQQARPEVVVNEAVLVVVIRVDIASKYEILTQENGSRFDGSETVGDGELVALKGDTEMSASQIASLTLRSSGTSHFLVTDDPAVKMYNAIACDFAG